MTVLANAAGVPAPGPKLTDWLASAALHVAAALALWQFAASVGPASPALQRIELPIRWAADAVVPDERHEPVEAAAAPPAPPARRRVVAPAPEAATRAAPRKPAQAPTIVQPEATSRTEPESIAAVAQPAPTSADAQPLRGAPDTESAAIREPAVAAQPAPVVAASAASATSTAAAAPVRPVAPDPGARQRWRNDLERLMREHKHYPLQARRMRQQGVVTVEARFSADGELLRCDVAGSSGFRSLDDAALKLVRAAAEALRAHHGPGALAELRIPIAYELSGS